MCNASSVWEGGVVGGGKDWDQKPFAVNFCLCVCAWVGVSVCKWWLGADILLL